MSTHENRAKSGPTWAKRAWRCALRGSALPVALYLFTGCAGGQGSIQPPPTKPNVADATAPADPNKKDDKTEESPSLLKVAFTPSEWFKPPPAPPGAADTLILRGDKFEADKPIAEIKNAKELSGAHELYRMADFEGAVKLFHAVAENHKNPPLVAEEARFYEAECLRRLQKYPKASDTYHKMITDFPSGVYREQGCQRIFDIANFWLEDTRAEMDRAKANQEHWYDWHSPFHTDTPRPFFDEEGRALEALEWVHLNDPTSPLADKALFLCGSVKFYREDYKDADHYFTEITIRHPNSPLAEQSVELAIVSKHLSTGGPEYDSRKCAEARQLVHTALTTYPKLAREKREFLERQILSCNLQQAEKDYLIAEFYKRTGHPGSAYFYYEIVRRRYPGTPFFDKATEKMLEMRRELEKTQASLPPAPSEPAAPRVPPGFPAHPEVTPQPRPAGAPSETAPQPRPVEPGGPPETAPQPRPVPPS